MLSSSAIDHALSAYRNPAHSKLARSKHVPKDILDVIKIAAGDDETLNAAATRKINATRETLVEAAKLYLQRELAAAGTDSAKLLLLQPGADAQAVKDHKRWLLKWLHPDRNENAWESKFFQKVREAAKALEVSGPPVAEKPAVEDSKRRRKKPKRFVVPLKKQRSLPRTILAAITNPISLSAVIGALLFMLIVRYAGESGLNALIGRS